MPPKESLKRKNPPPGDTRQTRNPKRNKMQESRTILAQPAHKILTENGELDVGSFVKSRQFEIEALEQGIKKSKHGLSTRAFQQVPRQLRRRTASHNVKKIPKRLRARAAKEIKEDNTPTGSARKKDMTSKQHIRREAAEKATKFGAKAKKQREALAKSQAHEDDGPDGNDEQDEDDEEYGSDIGMATAPSVINRGNEAPASIQPFHAPQTRKDELVKSARPVTKFRKRQKDKTWLPTHLFHAKRAHMTLPSEPLWRFAIPLSPTEKVYRVTHRAATLRGCVAWDMSYMSTIMLDGTENSLLNIFKRMGVPAEQLSGKKGEKWRKGFRSWNGWLKEPGDQKRWITSALFVWRAEEQNPLMNLDEDSEPEPLRRSVLLRTHPAGFSQLWKELLKVAKEQRPAVKVEDLRFDVGSIDIEGPQASEVLSGISHELARKRLGEEHKSGVDWSTFAKTNPGSLPSGALLNLILMDPRLRHPPRTVPMDDIPEEQVLELMADWPGDKSSMPGLLFDRDARYASCTLQSSQKAINRRKGDAEPGEYPGSTPSDPRIPALLCATSPEHSKSRHTTWTLMLPWSWVLPFWYSLVYYPLSTGGIPRFAGLDEKRQLCFEQDRPWFPADFPSTQAGWNWEVREQASRQQNWKKRPKGKRVEWSSLDLGSGRKGELGRGWACDWDFLFGIKIDSSADEEKSGPVKEKTKRDKQDVKDGKQELLPEGVEHVFASRLTDPTFTPNDRSLLTVTLRLLHRGVPATCARIYQLPRADEKLRHQWAALVDVRSGKNSQPRIQHSTRASTGKDANDVQYPHVPGEEDLIGFVTTGNFNLGEGRGTGIGSISLAKVWAEENVDSGDRGKGLCIIREAGTSVGRLAEWVGV